MERYTQTPGTGYFHFHGVTINYFNNELSSIFVDGVCSYSRVVLSNKIAWHNLKNNNE